MGVGTIWAQSRAPNPMEDANQAGTSWHAPVSQIIVESQCFHSSSPAAGPPQNLVTISAPGAIALPSFIITGQKTYHYSHR